MSFISRHIGDNIIKKTEAIKAVLSYKNVKFSSMDLYEMSDDTPMEDFIRSQQLQDAYFVVAHTSDVLRYLILWKYGGTYLDTDMIVRTNLDSISSNFACEDSIDIVNGAVLNLDNLEVGRKVSRMFIDELIKTYNGSHWGNNGPNLITRVLQRVCGTTSVEKMIAMKECEGFHVMKYQMCYPVHGLQFARFFNESESEKVMKLVENSVVVHFWNNLSKKTILGVDEDVAYIQLAKEFCPKVMATCQEYF